ncbi:MULTISPECIES: gamma carbonic anhydrase family protein [unclassified Pseudomonas]|uniref:gamma carbonic anhydrase family protein n=1 Tax=Pseudomonas TaxID=286 RepID=UPI0005383559|nr:MULTISPECIES: gamma carbonic anhydrase family protein [unclassified Pseudomonas]MBD0682933.1 gamma carbonic anhydrase family protein [Pseudomonas sp. PSB18]CDF93957.1 carbonic anhydrase, family 3 [Pseudomonas sp. SHC52]
MAIYRYDTLIPAIHAETFVAEDATVIGDVTLAQGVSIWPQAVLRGDNEPIRIGQHSNVQEGAVLHADPGFALTVGEGVTVGHQAMLHGCTVGDGALIGIQAVVLNGAVIGRNCLVGAGAIVTEGKVFPDNSLILGAPAKVVRELTPEAVAGLHRNAEDYVLKGQAYRDKLIRIS